MKLLALTTVSALVFYLLIVLAARLHGRHGAQSYDSE
jgi:hypothetical protein